MALHDPSSTAPTEDPYAPTIRAFLTQCAGEDMEHRCAIMRMRDAATVSIRYDGDDALPVMQHIVTLATRYGLAEMTTDQLKGLRLQLNRLRVVAQALEEAERGRG